LALSVDPQVLLALAFVVRREGEPTRAVPNIILAVLAAVVVYGRLVLAPHV